MLNKHINQLITKLAMESQGNTQAVEAKDLELVEQRVTELEKYLGIEDIDIDTFQKTQLETFDKKAHKLDDFIKVIEDKHFFLMELYEKYE